MIQTELGMDINAFLDTVNIELPDGSKKLTRHLFAEMISTFHKNNHMDPKHTNFLDLKRGLK